MRKIYGSNDGTSPFKVTQKGQLIINPSSPEVVSYTKEGDKQTVTYNVVSNINGKNLKLRRKLVLSNGENGYSQTIVSYNYDSHNPNKACESCPTDQFMIIKSQDRCDISRHTSGTELTYDLSLCQKLNPYLKNLAAEKVSMCKDIIEKSMTTINQYKAIDLSGKPVKASGGIDSDSTDPFNVWRALGFLNNCKKYYQEGRQADQATQNSSRGSTSGQN